MIDRGGPSDFYAASSQLSFGLSHIEPGYCLEPQDRSSFLLNAGRIETQGHSRYTKDQSQLSVNRNLRPIEMASSVDNPVTTRPSITSKELELLEEAGVPAISLHDACKACDDPCFDDEDTHPDQVGFKDSTLTTGAFSKVLSSEE